MPATKSMRPAPKPKGSSSGRTGTYVKFSDKLTDSLTDITQMINQHKEMIDSIQDIALELTNAIGTLHTLTLKYASKANQILDILLPIVKGLPIIPDKGKQLLVDLEKWTQKIIDNQEKTTRTISDVQSGLNTGDVAKLKAHSKDLQNVTKSLTAILPKS